MILGNNRFGIIHVEIIMYNPFQHVINPLFIPIISILVITKIIAEGGITHGDTII